MNILIPRLNEGLFTWLNWSAGRVADLGLACRYVELTSARGIEILRKHAIGYSPAEKLLCRPKNNETALMCFKDEVEFWFHLRNIEFYEVFKIKMNGKALGEE